MSVKYTVKFYETSREKLELFDSIDEALELGLKLIRPILLPKPVENRNVFHQTLYVSNENNNAILTLQKKLQDNNRRFFALNSIVSYLLDIAYTEKSKYIQQQEKEIEELNKIIAANKICQNVKNIETSSQNVSQNIKKLNTKEPLDKTLAKELLQQETLSIQEVVTITGLHEATIYKHINDKKVPVCTVWGKRRIRVSDLKSYYALKVN
jgi:hypothetical protein